MGAPKPPVIPEPFANNATSSYKNTIPDTTVAAGAASWSLGFPPVTMQPEVSGGVPPFGQDFNGVLFALSAHDYYVQAGQLYTWDAGVVADIGGYAVGAVLASTDGTTVWYNTVANNSTNPDNDSTAAGWVPIAAYGFTNVTGLTGGNVTLAPSQTRKSVIVLTGTLTSNLNLILPTTKQQWLIVNQTSGNFVTTAKTAAGSGVVIPQGGFGSPVGVYGDGTNIYPTVAPLSVPIDQNPNPLTIAERDNTGLLQASYFLATSGWENPSLQPFQGFIGLGPDDATYRKYHIADVEAAMLLQNIGGAVTPSQVPLLSSMPGGVTPSQVPALSALLGSVLPGQVPSGAVTQFFTQSLGQTGWCQFPNGLIIQWGYATGGQNINVSFPKVFPNAAFAGFCNTANRNFMGGQGTNFVWGLTQFGMGITVDPTPGQGYWLAIGY
jgi:hypothetical protein